MHAYHDGLPGYHPEQILHDGCEECETRSARADHGLSSLDRHTFRLAWERAADWNRFGLSDVSRAEMPLLGMLWSVQVKLVSACGMPVGTLPNAAITLTDLEGM